MRTYNYISNFSGAIYPTLSAAIIDTIKDALASKSCRTIKAFSFSKYTESDFSQPVLDNNMQHLYDVYCMVHPEYKS